ncbi:MAG TPA: XRE family transcriptional regulator [Chloroflexota bacterium]|nr:XRE family transcriptional regulator [Chloroflexota bacterium]
MEGERESAQVASDERGAGPAGAERPTQRRARDARKAEQRGEQRGERRIGPTVRMLRERAGLSVRALAAATGFSPSFISQVENDVASPSIASLGRIVETLGSTLGAFFNDAVPGASTVTLADERHTIVSSWSQARLESLGSTGPAADGRTLEAVMVTFFPGGRSGKHPHTAPGEQFAIVFGGEITLTLNGDVHDLLVGDSAMIAPDTPHRWENTGSAPAQVVIVTAPPPQPRVRPEAMSSSA